MFTKNTLFLSIISSLVLPFSIQAADTETEEITVYGAKSTDTLNDVTSSIGYLSADAIKDQAIYSIRDAFRVLGNVSDSSFNDSGFVIRGVNSEGLTPGGSPLASLYVDGIQQTVNGARRGAKGLWDIQQVEVYRGPQSTLSGRAAMAGAIYLKTKDPEQTQSSAAQLSLGSDSFYNGALMFNTPLIDDVLAMRVTGEYFTKDSDIKFTNFEHYKNHDVIATDEYYQLRGKLLYTPSNKTKALLTYSYAYDSPANKDVGGPSSGGGFNVADMRGDFLGPESTEARETTNHNIGMELTHQLNNQWLFTLMTTLSSTELTRDSVNVHSDDDLYTDGSFEQDLFTQELRFNYQSELLKAVFGVYAAVDDSESFLEQETWRTLDSHTSDNENNFAIFGEVAYEFQPSWTLTLGGRIDDTSKESVVKSTEVRSWEPAPRESDFTTQYNETVFLPKLALSKQLTPDVLIGVSVQKGFRNGGGAFDRTSAQAYEYDAEYAWTSELFIRANSLNNKLRTQFNLFNTNFTDQQVEMPLGEGGVDGSRILNAAESNSQGFELEVKFLATDILATYASVGYTDTEFESFNDAQFGELSGLPFPEAPKWNASAGVSVNLDSGFFANLDASYNDEHLSGFANGYNPNAYVDAYTLVNMQLGYRGDNFDVTVFVENAFDESYLQYIEYVNDDIFAQTPGEARFAGVRTSWYF